MQKIGIVGQGFVGSAVYEGFKDHFEILRYDKYNAEKSNSNLKGLVQNCDVIFVCVPTPMIAETGEASIHIVKEVVDDLDLTAFYLGKNPTLVVKSTVPPGTIDYLNEQAQFVKVTFNPEFLTEANAINDFKNQNRIIIGTTGGYKADDVCKVFNQVFPDVYTVVCDSREAELCKYMINTFLSVKVSFANEIYDICAAYGINYNQVTNLAKLDTRLGNSHWMVPGPDGDRGFGGHCFKGNSTVLTTDGEITLEKAYSKYNLGESLKVHSFNHLLDHKEIKNVSDVTCNLYDGELIKFTLENDSVLECTPDHLFPIKRNDKIILVKAKNIIETDEFIKNT